MARTFPAPGMHGGATRVSSKGQIVLPVELRNRDRIQPGQEFQVERLARGKYRLTRRTASPNAGLLEWLLACPEKGFFVPIAFRID